jgi:hypothetical protein
MTSNAHPESRIALGFLAKLGLVAPLALLGGGLVDGVAGVLTAALALVGLVGNFLVMLLAFREGSRFGMGGLMVAAFVALLAGLALLTALTLPFVHASWMRLGVFAVVVIGGYLGAVLLTAREVARRAEVLQVRPWRIPR